MFARRHTLLAATAAFLTLGVAATAANAADVFTLKSTTFEDGKMMPQKVANSKANGGGNPNCVGENVSPQLSWTNVPDGTKSFVLLMVDPEGRGGAGVMHWVAYGIPASVTGFAEGETSKQTDKFVGGKSTQGVGFYSGPCTPPGQYAAPLYVHVYRHRFRTDRAAARPDTRRSHSEARTSRPATVAYQGGRRADRLVRQSLASVIGIVVERSGG